LKSLESTPVNSRIGALRAVIQSNILPEHKVEGLTSKIGDTIPSFFTKINGEVKVKPWLKTRLFETVLASAGMDEYLKELLSHEDVKPEEVPINSLLASFLISNSVNPFAFELINELASGRKISLTREQMDALSVVLKPKKDYAIYEKSVHFSSEQVQNIRNEVLRKSLDILAAYEQYKSADSRKPQAIHKIPNDLRRVTYVPDFTIEQLLLISSKYGASLKLTFVDGYLVWQFKDQPAIYIKFGEAYYSPRYSRRKGTTPYEQADRQVYHFIEQLESFHLPSVRCTICGQRSTSDLYYHLERGIIPVCNICSKEDQKVVGIVSRLRHKG